MFGLMLFSSCLVVAKQHLYLLKNRWKHAGDNIYFENWVNYIIFYLLLTKLVFKILLLNTKHIL